MPRIGKRIRISTGIYRDGTGGAYEVRVVVGGHAYAARMPKDSTPKELKAKHAELEDLGRNQTPKAERGTLRADVPRYLKLVGHLASLKERRAHLDAWLARGLGDRGRHRITSQDVLSARVAWLKDGKAPKTINHRVGTLRHLYKTLDGQSASTPCDEVTPLEVPKTPIVRISDARILLVDRTLQTLEAGRGGRPISPLVLPRFRVYASCGKRPCEIGRTQPGDIDLDARVWVPRDAKGGFCPGVYLNEDQLAAWRFFHERNAYGEFDTGHFARTLRLAGWPAGVRPYQMRHTTWITASERGVSLDDISVGAGHTDPRMTRKAYVPVLGSRLQRMSETLDGRFNGWKSVESKRGTDDPAP